MGVVFFPLTQQITHVKAMGAGTSSTSSVSVFSPDKRVGLKKVVVVSCLVHQSRKSSKRLLLPSTKRNISRRSTRSAWKGAGNNYSDSSSETRTKSQTVSCCCC